MTLASDRRRQESLQSEGFRPVASPCGLEGEGRSVTPRDLDLNLPLHVWQGSVYSGGVTYGRCSCSVIVSDAHSELPETCPVATVEAHYLPALAQLQAEYAASLSRTRAIWKADAERLNLARLAESA